MSGEYTKLDNFIRSYFNQDTVCEINSDDLGEIIDLYLSEVSQNGVKELLIDVSMFIDDNKNQSLDEYFETKFSSYLDMSPVENFFSLLNSKYREKYPEIKSTVVSYLKWSTLSKKTQHRRRVLKKFRSKVPSHGFDFSSEPMAASIGLIHGKAFKRNEIKRGARKPYYVLVADKPKSEAAKKVLLAKKRQFLFNSLKESIEATDIILLNGKIEEVK
ncbi:contact-dependent growth inhibition system immunity protein [Klebsiella pneumoniae]|uniref:contact-dependent growth inhibition system immunity protein n=1 Tax=Klebsiella variicola TaxID=244366 RepID=UPI0003BE7E74|nr:contact-dependent growth inhibition system immunity protein [Klebsiella variicola]MCP6190095.1 contact-dependent growth inhibition system immunity protein [Klebsiella pneumoniae]HDH1455620.1 hypothetical protein [Klebsiella quasipneumoniae subsp. quasipneumoniae]ESM71782.1 hypothetical protein L386_02893 [Klebsiella variicola]HBR5656575.1 hypothetical protein [Klebsiella pneumoniae]HBV6324737.1 hypothetical protein [Klebsiella pneumoniae]